DLCLHWGVALTGGIASGKSTVGKSLRERGFTVIDADQASRLVVLPGTDGFHEIVAYFGQDLLLPTGELDRAKMREIVFADTEKRLKLESIIHHRLAVVSEGLLRKEGLFENPRPWFYEASLIYERKREKDFSAVWVVFCPEDLQIERVMKRDNITREQAVAILKVQMPPAEKVKKADLVIRTDCSNAELENQITDALSRMQTGVKP
ncbi:MAG: dephospho-CoA kinase, partial [Proteobacteria bacterium]